MPSSKLTILELMLHTFMYYPCFMITYNDKKDIQMITLIIGSKDHIAFISDSTEVNYRTKIQQNRFFT